MKKIILVLAMALISIVTSSQTSQYVNGYYKSNGRYVQEYYRTVANNTVYDNYSTKLNVNSYTGKKGTKTYNTSYSSYKSTGYYKRRR